MKDLDIDKMPAGREMDALIAEKVMDAEVYREFHTARFKQGQLPNGHELIGIGGIPRYSTDIAAAWEVVKRLKNYNFYIRLFYDGRYGCSFTEPPRIIAWGNTAPLAICRAALKALKGGQQ